MFFRVPKQITDKHIKETVMRYNLKITGEYPSKTQDKDKLLQKAAISDPKINSETFKMEQEEQITQPVVNTSRSDPIQDLII